MQSFLLQEVLNLSEPPGFIVNHLSKAKIPVAERVPLRITQKAVDEWARNQAGIISDLKDPRAVRRNYSQCAPTIGPRCAYFDYCHAENDEIRDQNFKKEE